MITLLMAVACLASACGEYDVTLKDWPRLAGEKDDTGRLQRAVDAASLGGVLYVPKGTYPVSSPIMVTNGASLLMHKSAIVRAVAKMPYVFDVDLSRYYRGWKPTPNREHDYNLFVKGGQVDGNGCASCLHLQKYLHFTLEDTTFMNGFPYGLHVDKLGAEVMANNLYFKGTKSGCAGNVALYTQGCDSHYTDCVVVDYTVGVRATAGSNRFTRFHVWGGGVPPKPGEKVGEMLVHSICYQILGGMNTLRDCYADTGWIGFDIDGAYNQILGCWYICNATCHLDDVTIVRQLGGSELTIADCIFQKSVPHTRVYEGNGRVSWRNIAYQWFGPDEDQPGAGVYAPDQNVTTADGWNLLNVRRPLVFKSEPNEFVEKDSCRSFSFDAGLNRLRQKFPKAGPGREVIVRARATTPETKRVEFRLHFLQGRIWGTDLPLTTEWRDIRVPFEKLRYFSHYAGMPKLEPGEMPDARKLINIGFSFGRWLCADTIANAHGFEVESVRIVGR